MDHLRNPLRDNLFAYLKIDKSNNPVPNSPIIVNSRLWLKNGTLDPNNNSVSMANGSLLRRTAATCNNDLSTNGKHRGQL